MTWDRCFSKRTLPPHHCSNSPRLVTWSADPPMVTNDGSSGSDTVTTPTKSSVATVALHRRSALDARAAHSKATPAARSHALRWRRSSPDGRSNTSLNGYRSVTSTSRPAVRRTSRSIYAVSATAGFWRRAPMFSRERSPSSYRHVPPGLSAGLPLCRSNWRSRSARSVSPSRSSHRTWTRGPVIVTRTSASIPIRMPNAIHPQVGRLNIFTNGSSIYTPFAGAAASGRNRRARTVRDLAYHVGDRSSPTLREPSEPTAPCRHPAASARVHADRRVIVDARPERPAPAHRAHGHPGRFRPGPSGPVRESDAIAPVGALRAEAPRPRPGDLGVGVCHRKLRTACLPQRRAAAQSRRPRPGDRQTRERAPAGGARRVVDRARRLRSGAHGAEGRAWPVSADGPRAAAAARP